MTHSDIPFLYICRRNIFCVCIYTQTERTGLFFKFSCNWEHWQKSQTGNPSPDELRSTQCYLSSLSLFFVCLSCWDKASRSRPGSHPGLEECSALRSLSHWAPKCWSHSRINNNWWKVEGTLAQHCPYKNLYCIFLVSWAGSGVRWWHLPVQMNGLMRKDALLDHILTNERVLYKDVKTGSSISLSTLREWSSGSKEERKRQKSGFKPLFQENELQPIPAWENPLEGTELKRHQGEPIDFQE